MTATMQQLKSPKNKPETIINHTKPNFTSPLDLFIQNNCTHCHNYNGLCRPNDSRGLTPMSLCISLYTHQIPADFGEILKQTKPEAQKTPQEASAEVE